MSEAKTYNGWTNYETWNVKLWMDNEQGSYNYWTATAQECYDDAEADDTFTRKERAAFDLADRLKSEHEEAMPEVSGMWADLLSAALSDVNWHEIAENMLDDVDEDETDDDSGDE